MAVGGRNQRCGCGSGRKVKRCCGEVRGPSAGELARAWLAGEARRWARELARYNDGELDGLFREVVELPRLDSSLLVSLPRLVTPDLDRVRHAIEDDDVDGVEAALPTALARCDTPLARAALGRAVVALASADRLERPLAAMALIDLTDPNSVLVRSSLVEAVAVDAGAVSTATGLVVAH